MHDFLFHTVLLKHILKQNKAGFTVNCSYFTIFHTNSRQKRGNLLNEGSFDCEFTSINFESKKKQNTNRL